MPGIIAPRPSLVQLITLRAYATMQHIVASLGSRVPVMRLTTFSPPRLPPRPSHPSPMPFDPIARFYDADHGRLTADIPALLAFAEKTGGPVLDLGVGTGRLALAMAGAGHEVVGIDSAAGMLAIARAHIAAAGLEKLVALVEGDFRALTDRSASAWPIAASTVSCI